MRENIKHMKSGRGLLGLLLGAMIVTAVLVFGGKKSSLTGEWIRFCQERWGEDVYVMPSKTRWNSLEVLQEEVGSTRRLMLRLESETEENSYQWLKLSDKQKMEDFAEIQEALHRFAESRRMTGTISIYVELCLTETKLHAFYDELTGWMWLPAGVDAYLEMYEKFETLSCCLVLQREGGEEFLRERQLVQVQNGVLREKKGAEYQIVTGD